MRCAVLQNEMILERQFREAWFLTAVFIHNIHTCVYSNNQTALSYPQMPRFLKFLREFWSMPLPLMIHSALALFAQRTCIPTSARSIGFCVIWVCISSSSSSEVSEEARDMKKIQNGMALLLRAWKSSQETKCNITCLKSSLRKVVHGVHP